MSNTSDFGRQMYTYWLIAAHIRAHGYPPTNEELAAQRGVTTNTIYEHLRQLEQRGYITRVRGWRNVRLVEKDAA